ANAESRASTRWSCRRHSIPRGQSLSSYSRSPPVRDAAVQLRRLSVIARSHATETIHTLLVERWMASLRSQRRSLAAFRFARNDDPGGISPISRDGLYRLGAIVMLTC